MSCSVDLEYWELGPYCAEASDSDTADTRRPWLFRWVWRNVAGPLPSSSTVGLGAVTAQGRVDSFVIPVGPALAVWDEFLMRAG